MKAIKWGIFVGSMFGMHRYYRSRDINNAFHWFGVMSCFSATNIWVSTSLQEFTTDYGSRKAVSLTQRNKYHTDAYTAYVDKVSYQTKSLDYNISAALYNDKSRAFEELVGEIQTHMKTYYGT